MKHSNLISAQLEEFMFERNDEPTRQRLSAQLAKALTDSAGDLFTVICDETNNPPSVVDANMIHGAIREKTQKPEEIHYYFEVRPSTKMEIVYDT
jgi:hypothetical protein